MKALKALAHDVDLRDVVLAELAMEPEVDNSRIRVSVKDGVVVLAGYVTASPQKAAAVAAAQRVSGAKTLVNDIQVVLPDSVIRRDASIAEKIERERQWSASLPDTITVEVSKGVVTLSGEVEWSYQRARAARAVRDIHGVTAVENGIVVAPR